MNKKICAFVFLILMRAPLTHAKDLDLKWSELRVFADQTTFSQFPSDLNDLAKLNGIDELHSVVGFGLEANAELKEWFKLGTKFKGVFSGSNKKEASSSTTDYLSVQQYSAGLTGRINLLKSDSLLIDTFVELGLSNNTIEIHTSVGQGKWEKNSHFYQRAGLTAAFGGPSFKFFAEGGYEVFKLDNPEYQGTIGSQIQTIDLSGTFVGVGMIISGIPSWIKPGSVSSGN
ncbi:MAG: hypothetical protein K2P92_05740 [Bdellovibrionaceae bacterium]|nr:hypothetical protein [Pseudobdellovibrionaceae bacterium]